MTHFFINKVFTNGVGYTRLGLVWRVCVIDDGINLHKIVHPYVKKSHLIFFSLTDLKRLYFTAGVENKPTVFLFVDTQVVEEVFLEDISNILSSGEVPNLYKPDEFEEVRNALSDDMKKAGIDDTPANAFQFLLDRVKGNLHLVLGMSPVGEAFR